LRHARSSFKLVNDSLGRGAGDELLEQAAVLLRRCLRETDTAARLGGDEFGVLLTNLHDELDASRIAMKIVETLCRPMPVKGQSVYCTVSIGIATVPRNGEDAAELLQQSDTAMHHAKRRGRNRAEFFTEEMNTLVTRRATLETGLRTAVDAGGLHLHYQPIFDLRRERLVGAEALIRWQHPELGALAPDDFLHLAEDSGQILGIGEWVLNTACQQAAVWQSQGHEGFRIAVNVSPRQLQESTFHETVQEALVRSSLDPKSLELEITESTLVRDADVMVKALHDLKQIGVHLSIDDFGTGYSALSYLKDLPIDLLKIDRSFVNSLMVDPAGATIVETIVRMAHGLNLTTVAEGVEQHDQLLLLGSYGCNRMQGYLFGRPVSPEGFTRWINDPTFRWAPAGTHIVES
jgi:diguanylate cyclase (GGDEF)-like protein